MSDDVFADNNWHHIVGVYDGGTAVTDLEIYVDGVHSDTASISQGTYVAMENKSNPLTIGWAPVFGGSNFDGLIDDVRIYNYALTPLQIRTEYNQGAVRFGPSSGLP